MSDEMATKYQQYYNQIINGTLSDTILKSISFQANIKLANDIIAEQEKTIADLEESVGSLKKELEESKTDKNKSENSKINELEGNIKSQNEIISKLNSDLLILNKIKIDYENFKNQVSHLDTFKNELNKSREETAKLKKDYEVIIEELNKKIEYLQLTPAKRKKIDELNSNNNVNTVLLPVDSVKDGGSF